MKRLLAILTLVPALLFAKTIELDKNNTINFNQAFTGEYVAHKQVEAISTCMKNVGKEIYIVLYSPGGSISAGQLFIDTLNALPCTFHTISIFSASMAYQTVQNLGHRYTLPSGILMSHRAQISGLRGELGGDLDQYIKLIKDNVEELEIVAADRAGISLEAYKDLISDELWMTARTAVEMKHADEVVLVKCGADLMGTHMETVNTFFGSFNVEFSDCPIITAPLSFQASRTVGDSIPDFGTYFNNISNRVDLAL